MIPKSGYRSDPTAGTHRQGQARTLRLSAQGADDVGLQPALALVERRRCRPGRRHRRAFLLGLHVDAAAGFKAAGPAHDGGGRDTIGSAVGRRQATLVPGHDAGPPQRHGAGGILGRAAGAAGEVVHLLAGAFEALSQALKRFIDAPPGASAASVNASSTGPRASRARAILVRNPIMTSRPRRPFG